MPIADYQSVENAFSDGSIPTRDSEELGDFLMALANKPIPNEMVRHRDIIRGLTINHILLHRHMDKLTRDSRWTQWLVIALAVLTLLLSLPQIWLAWRADIRESASARSAQSTPAASPPKPPLAAGSNRPTKP